jgi:hypothetical protein
MFVANHWITQAFIDVRTTSEQSAKSSVEGKFSIGVQVKVNTVGLSKVVAAPNTSRGSQVDIFCGFL